ncbi:MAG: hypothetical protein ACYCZH_10070 [Sulfuriferula sp.]
MAKLQMQIKKKPALMKYRVRSGTGSPIHWRTLNDASAATRQWHARTYLVSIRWL